MPTMKRNDLLIITLVLIITTVTAYNSRYTLIPTPPGHTYYSKHNIAIQIPTDLYIWELPINTHGNIILDGSTHISKETGIIGWNERNSNNPRPKPTGNWQESSVIWLKTESQDPIPYLFYNQLYTYATRNNMILNLTKGPTTSFTHRNHQAKLQYFNYTLHNTETDETLHNYGIVACYYCTKTQRTIELFYIDIYNTDPTYNPATLYNEFKTILDTLHCH
jgi:hypothetical protein